MRRGRISSMPCNANSQILVARQSRSIWVAASSLFLGGWGHRDLLPGLEGHVRVQNDEIPQTVGGRAPAPKGRGKVEERRSGSAEKNVA